MPELPEVETTRRAIAQQIHQRIITSAIIRNHQLRWPIDPQLSQKMHNAQVVNVARRAKFLIIETSKGNLILHLGMSGSLRYLPANVAAEKHDHLDIVFDNQHCLRLRDPRRFGACLWTTEPVEQHPLLCKLGPEPLSKEFTDTTLFDASRNRKVAVKNFIMNSHVVVGVGNIYASESLFMAGILPTKPAGKISRGSYQKLTRCIQEVLEKSIAQGGTTLRDFTSSDGKPGYFQQTLMVYQREGEACLQCGASIKQIRIGQRSSFYCPHCQR